MTCHPELYHRKPPTHGHPPDGPQPPDAPLLPEEPVMAKPAWHSVPQRTGRKQKKKQDVPPPQRMTPGPEPRQSWATWQRK
jgi:hypothetical protein